MTKDEFQMMVRNLTSHSEDMQWMSIVHDILERADNVTRNAEKIIQKSNSIFNAHLMLAKADQVQFFNNC